MRSKFVVRVLTRPEVTFDADEDLMERNEGNDVRRKREGERERYLLGAESNAFHSVKASFSELFDVRGCDTSTLQETGEEE